MENNYDIKYVVAVFNKPGKLALYPYSEDSIIGYVVSKAYVVSEETEMVNNEEYTYYNVVLPYEGISNTRYYPEFDKHGNPVNAERTERVYDSFESAKEACDVLNSLHKCRLFSLAYSRPKYVSLYRTSIEEAVSDYKTQKKECDTLEYMLKERTRDLKTKTLVKAL